MRLHFFFCVIALIWTPIYNVGGTGLIDAPPGPLLFTDLDEDYRVYQKKLSWEDALAFCSKCYGSFATFEDPQEAEKVLLHIYNISFFNQEYDSDKEKSEWGLDRRYWVGLTDNHRVPPGRKKRAPDEPAVWTWIKKVADTTGTPADAIKTYWWYPKQPDHDTSKNPEHCGGFWNPTYHVDQFKNGQDLEGRQEYHSLNDYPCDHLYYFICKKGDDADAPTDPTCTATQAPDQDAGGAAPGNTDKRSVLKENSGAGVSRDGGVGSNKQVRKALPVNATTKASGGYVRLN